MGGGRRVSFYFVGKGEEEDSPSKLDDDSDSSEDEWGEGREDGEDADKENNIKTARAVFIMTCLEFVLDDVKPLSFLHFDVEGWETYALRGAGVALHGVDNTCFVVCEVWDERDRKRRHISPSGTPIVFGTPCDDVLAVMAEHSNFERIDDIDDQDRNMCLRFRGEEDSGDGR